MDHILLGNIWFVIIAIAWILYVLQESFIVGSAMYNVFICKDEGERKQIQVSTGIHWDGIEVWFITAVGATFASFPLAFATTFEFLYIPVFLLVYALILRGISIELIYKSDNSKWQKWMSIIWAISSFLISLVIGVYLVTIFLGVPISSTGIEGNFLSIFNISGLSGGLLLVVLSLVTGAGFIDLSTKGDLGDKAFKLLKKSGLYVLIPLLTLIVFFGANHKDTSMFGNGLYMKYNLLFVLPLFTVVAGIASSYLVYKGSKTKAFVMGLITLALYLIAMFVGAFPHMLPSTINHEYSISVADAMASYETLNIMFVAGLIFIPLVLAYQTWKYIRFSKRVSYFDKEEQ